MIMAFRSVWFWAKQHQTTQISSHSSRHGGITLIRNFVPVICIAMRRFPVGWDRRVGIGWNGLLLFQGGGWWTYHKTEFDKCIWTIKARMWRGISATTHVSMKFWLNLMFQEFGLLEDCFDSNVFPFNPCHTPTTPTFRSRSSKLTLRIDPAYEQIKELIRDFRCLSEWKPLGGRWHQLLQQRFCSLATIRVENGRNPLVKLLNRSCEAMLFFV